MILCIIDAKWGTLLHSSHTYPVKNRILLWALCKGDWCYTDKGWNVDSPYYITFIRHFCGGGCCCCFQSSSFLKTKEECLLLESLDLTQLASLLFDNKLTFKILFLQIFRFSSTVFMKQHFQCIYIMYLSFLLDF